MPAKPTKRRAQEADIKVGRSVVTISPAQCAKKEKIDKEAKDALDEIGRIARIVRADKKLRMRLHAVKGHLKTIMGDHHNL
jgi:hypothetical protein